MFLLISYAVQRLPHRHGPAAVQFTQMGQIRHIALHAEPAAQDGGNALRVQLALGAVVMDVDAFGVEP